ncbi:MULTISPECIES: hypothetical protein [Vibrio]|uniref:hypothetical protein n=1 Tax=Vibrio TaxID=662 RepID=UPI00036B6EE0|nr:MULTISPECIES: hypothetical protein [Vibrio]ELB2912205.1 hypothetical protein [Vibrio parahaemolyticus]MCR9548987.1 hypothetical protein [Vibrio antiquarius]HBI3715622.1 hypothetical protein [Vibrio parahaemolyticus]
MKKTLMQQQVKQCVQDLVKTQERLSPEAKRLSDQEVKEIRSLLHEAADLIQMLA